MALMKIYLYGSPILSRPTQPVTELPADFSRILNDMYESMYDDDGIGLSANQAGIDQSFFVADFSLHDEKQTKKVFINPEILESSGECVLEEGCLSIPEIHEEVTRAERIKLRYEDLDRNVIEEEFSDFPARVIQHEIDHLHGVFFVDRISALRKSFLASKLKKIAEDAANGQYANV